MVLVFGGNFVIYYDQLLTNYNNTSFPNCDQKKIKNSDNTYYNIKYNIIVSKAYLRRVVRLSITFLHYDIIHD